MKKLLTALVALSLTSCSTFPAMPGIELGAPPTSITNPAAHGLIASWRALRALNQTADFLASNPVGNPVLAPGSPRAIAVANALDRARDALNAATNALRAGNSGDYATAMAEATQAFEAIKTAMGG